MSVLLCNHEESPQTAARDRAEYEAAVAEGVFMGSYAEWREMEWCY